MKKVLTRFTDWGMDILTAGRRNSLEIGEFSRVVFLNAVTIAGALMIGLFAFIGFASANYPLAIASTITVSIVSINLLFIRYSHRFIIGGIVDCVVIFVFYVYLAWSGGEAGSGILWSMTYPLITLFLLGPVWGSLTASLYGAAIGLIVFLPVLNQNGYEPLYAARIVGTYFFIYVFGLIYELVRRKNLASLSQSNANLTRVTDELVAEKKQSDDILSGVLEGIFLLDKELKLGEAHSAHLEKLLECKDPSGLDFIELVGPRLGDKDREAAVDFLQLFMRGAVNDDLLAEINPLAEIDMNFPRGDGSSVNKRLSFQFLRVSSMQSPYPILCVVNDLTDEHRLKVQLETEEREHRRSMENLFQIIHIDPVMMREFIYDTEAELESVNDLMRNEQSDGAAILETLFQSAHSIKGNAALLGLKEFSEKVHEFEDKVKDKIASGYQWRDLLELTLGLAEIRKQVDSLKQLIEKIMHFQQDSRSAGLQDSSLLRYTIEKMIKKEAERSATPVKIEFEGFGRECVPTEYRKLVKDVLVQFIRNSFAHGFEPQELRKGSKKTPEGTIRLALESDGAQIHLRYRDDGRGLDPEALRRKGREIPELSEKVSAMSSGELAKLIFHPGFSTARQTGMDAGRGVGMGLVRNRVAQAGGKLSMRSTPGQYLEFSISLPIPVSEARASS